MAATLLFDFSRVFLFAKDKNYKGELNVLYKSLISKPDYKFFDHFIFNEELFGIAERLKLKTDLFMFTSGIIQEAPEIQTRLNGLFREIYSANKLGYSKSDPLAYTNIAGKIGTAQEEIIFIDDMTKNILAAQEANLKTILYSGNLQLLGELSRLINFTM